MDQILTNFAKYILFFDKKKKNLIFGDGYECLLERFGL